MMSPSYLSIDNLTAIAGDTAPPGTLAYFSNSYIQHYGLIALDQDGTRLLLSLGGEHPLSVYKADDRLETAITITDWRIDVDPTSAVALYHERFNAGQAFITEYDTGLVGFRAGFGIRYASVAVNRSGSVNLMSSGTHRGAFNQWRIVTGSADRPMTLVESSRVASLIAT